MRRARPWWAVPTVVSITMVAASVVVNSASGSPTSQAAGDEPWEEQFPFVSERASSDDVAPPFEAVLPDPPANVAEVVASDEVVDLAADTAARVAVDSPVQVRWLPPLPADQQPVVAEVPLELVADPDPDPDPVPAPIEDVVETPTSAPIPEPTTPATVPESSEPPVPTVTDAPALVPDSLPPTIEESPSAPTPPAGPLGAVSVSIVDEDVAAAAGLPKVAFTLDSDNALIESGGRVEVAVDYSSFRDAYGADWAGRLRLVVFADC